MDQEVKRNLTKLKHHNGRGMLGLIDHITALLELFIIPETAGALTTEEDKYHHLTDIISNDSLSTGILSYILASLTFMGDLQAADTHMVTTTGHLKLIRKPDNN